MAHPLIGIHAFLGELGAISFLWAFVEILANYQNLKRARIAAILGTIFFS